MKIHYDNGVTSGTVDTDDRPPLLPKYTPMDAIAECFRMNEDVVEMILISDDGSRTTLRKKN